LPKGISEEEVSKIYLKAYEENCKGVTIYVDGSRSGVLIKDEKKEERPESLQCDIYVVKVKGKDWIVLIGLKENRPFEVFAFKQGNLQITHDLPNAQLIKRRLKTGNKYDLIANSHFKLNDVSSFFELGEEQSLTRQISLNLRYGIVPMEEIVEQLDKAVGSVIELSKAVSRVLKKYIKNQVKKETCPECGSEDIIYESGCKKCATCGYSKC
jgi:ribonucleoside-diphosphate reductase alpha chain